MDRLRSGFHGRKSRKESPSLPTIITDTSSSGKTTPEHGAQQPLQVPGGPTKKTSPFRALRDLSRSHKRARSPATGSDTNSPASALSALSALSTLSARDSPVDRYMTSPHPLSAVAPDTQSNHSNNGSSATTQAPRMPSFLTLSPQDIDARFQEIVWMERNRMMLSVTNPSPEFRWARVTGDHLRKLDRYMNIQPWQNNRVRLRVPPGKQDYINASPISLTSVLPARIRHDGGDKNEDSTEDLAGGGPDRYIAMQGPKRKTTDHVWRMVVEQLDSPGVIVMLTETHEGNMEKCYPYFPRSPDEAPLEVNRKNEFGDGFRASVRCEAIEETEAGEAIELRKLVVRVYASPIKDEVHGSSSDEYTPVVENPVDESGDVKMLSPVKADQEAATDETDAASVTVEVGRASEDQEASAPAQPPSKESCEDEDDYEERTVWHFLYKKWPDFGVPALEDLDSFFTLMRLSREKNANPSNPRIVHCSAGVGRSGTFIALEHLMREMDAGVLESWDAMSQTPGQETQADGAGGEDQDAASTQGHNGHLRDEAEDGDDVSQKMDVEEETENRDEGPEAAEPDDLVFQTVNQLREQRRTMVQAESQFQFIYSVMRKLWEDRYGTNGTTTTSNHVTPVSEHPPRLPTPDGEPAAKRLEFDPFVEE